MSKVVLSFKNLRSLLGVVQTKGFSYESGVREKCRDYFKFNVKFHLIFHRLSIKIILFYSLKKENLRKFLLFRGEILAPKK